MENESPARSAVLVFDRPAKARMRLHHSLYLIEHPRKILPPIEYD